MNGAWTSASLLSKIASEAALPSNFTDDLTADNVLEMANDELLGYLVPLVMSTVGAYFERLSDTTTVAGTSAYRIPSRSIGGRLSDVYILDGNNTVARPAAADSSDPATLSDPTDLGNPPMLYYMRNHYLVLSPAPVAGLTLRMKYHLRPGDLVQTSGSTGCRRITNRSSGTLTVDVTVPGSWSTANKFDVVMNRPGFETVVLESSASSVSGTTVVLSTASSSELADIYHATYDGDFVCLAGQSPIPQIPYELHPVLFQRTLARVLKTLKDSIGAQAAMDTAMRLEEQALRIIAPRIEGADFKISPVSSGVRGF